MAYTKGSKVFEYWLHKVKEANKAALSSYDEYTSSGKTDEHAQKALYDWVYLEQTINIAATVTGNSADIFPQHNNLTLRDIDTASEAMKLEVENDVVLWGKLLLVCMIGYIGMHDLPESDFGNKTDVLVNTAGEVLKYTSTFIKKVGGDVNSNNERIIRVVFTEFEAFYEKLDPSFPDIVKIKADFSILEGLNRRVIEMDEHQKAMAAEEIRLAEQDKSDYGAHLTKTAKEDDAIWIAKEEEDKQGMVLEVEQIEERREDNSDATVKMWKICFLYKTVGMGDVPRNVTLGGRTMPEIVRAFSRGYMVDVTLWDAPVARITTNETKMQSGSCPDLRCCICIQKIQQGCRRVHCGHLYHQDCLENWLSFLINSKIKPFCAFCSEDVITRKIILPTNPYVGESVDVRKEIETMETEIKTLENEMHSIRLSLDRPEDEPATEGMKTETIAPGINIQINKLAMTATSVGEFDNLTGDLKKEKIQKMVDYEKTHLHKTYIQTSLAYTRQKLTLIDEINHIIGEHMEGVDKRFMINDIEQQIKKLDDRIRVNDDNWAKSVHGQENRVEEMVNEKIDNEFKRIRDTIKGREEGFASIFKDLREKLQHIRGQIQAGALYTRDEIENIDKGLNEIDAIMSTIPSNTPGMEGVQAEITELKDEYSAKKSESMIAILQKEASPVQVLAAKEGISTIVPRDTGNIFPQKNTHLAVQMQQHIESALKSDDVFKTEYRYDVDDEKSEVVKELYKSVISTLPEAYRFMIIQPFKFTVLRLVNKLIDNPEYLNEWLEPTGTFLAKSVENWWKAHRYKKSTNEGVPLHLRDYYSDFANDQFDDLRTVYKQGDILTHIVENISNISKHQDMFSNARRRIIGSGNETTDGDCGKLRCGICLNPVERGCRITACQHGYHKDCLRNWIQIQLRSGIFPICTLCGDPLIPPSDTDIVCAVTQCNENLDKCKDRYEKEYGEDLVRSSSNYTTDEFEYLREMSQEVVEIYDSLPEENRTSPCPTE